MPTRLHPSQAIVRIDKAVTALATEQVKLLLETKHLYQRVSIDPMAKISAMCEAFVYTGQPERVPKYLESLPQKAFQIGAGEYFAINPDGSSGAMSTSPAIDFENVKMHCSVCKDREPFTPTWMRDIDRDTENTGRYRTTPQRARQIDDPVEQHFCVAYLCTGCSSEMVVVIVARRGWYLSLEGRSPLEIVGAPTFIPKKERHLFAEAMVARNVGKTLAAIFFLRTFIEQFARRQTGYLEEQVKGDQLMEEYADTIPLDYRKVIPSLKAWYSNLSIAIHSAKADEGLLSEAMTEIEKHFKVRDTFGISDVTAAPKSKREAVRPDGALPSRS